MLTNIASTPAASTPSGLIRGLGPFAAMSMNIANMIGTGVFLKARVMTCNVGSPVEVLMVWVAAALLVLMGALTYAELAAMMPRAGGEYVFLREAFGKRTGFLYGWSYLIISRGGSLAAQAVGCAIFLNVALGGILSRPYQPYVAALVIAAMTLVNCLSVNSTGRIASVLTAIKVTTVAGVGVIAFAFSRGDWGNYGLSGAAGLCEGVPAYARGGMQGFGAAMLGALWGFQGWATLTPMVGEVADPKRNIPRAFLGAVLVVATVYLIANAGYFYVLTPVEVASVPSSSSVATEVIVRFLGPGAAGLMAMAMTISSLGALHTGIAATIRVPYAMARDGVFFRGLDKLSSNHVPVRSAILLAVLTGLLALAGSYDKLTDWAIFCLWLFYGLNAVGLFVLRRKLPDVERPYRVWGYPVVPALFLATTAWLLINTLVTAPFQAFSGIAVMILGLPLYWYWSRKAGVVTPGTEGPA